MSCNATKRRVGQQAVDVMEQAGGRRWGRQTVEQEQEQEEEQEQEQEEEEEQEQEEERLGSE